MTFYENNESIAVRVHNVTIFRRDHSTKSNIILRFLTQILMCMWINSGEGVEEARIWHEKVIKLWAQKKLKISNRPSQIYFFVFTSS